MAQALAFFVMMAMVFAAFAFLSWRTAVRDADFFKMLLAVLNGVAGLVCVWIFYTNLGD